LYTPNLITTLLNTFLDCWDKVRESLYELLLLIPAPLPSYTTPQQAQELVRCAKQLISSARQRESDSGALILRLIYAKYIPLGWTVDEEMNLKETSRPDESSMFFLQLLFTYTRCLFVFKGTSWYFEEINGRMCERFVQYYKTICVDWSFIDHS
jgi:hypothetical protein